ncbi:hypothetical protein S7335_780 [Synechococcus sp. PCC 7335]|nr:hypothetical protein S7335_780 [Synechococcus sp. PCC 7335]
MFPSQPKLGLHSDRALDLKIEETLFKRSLQYLLCCITLRQG